MLFRAIVAGLVIIGACGQDARTTDAVVVRDSAGVKIVESSAPTWNAGEEWTISPHPIVEFGAEEGLYRIVAGFRAADGRIILAQAGTLEILIFTKDGELLQRIGGAGGGPGEFRDLSRVRRMRGDSLIVFDLLNARITTMDEHGRVGHTHGTPSLPTGVAALLEDVFGDGSLLATPAGGPPAGRRLERRERSLWRVEREGELALPLAEFPEQEMYFFERMPRPIAFRQPFFGNSAYYVAGRDRLHWGKTDTYQIHTIGLDGNTKSLIRRAVEQRSYGPHDVTALIEKTVSNHGNQQARPALRAVLAELPTSGTVPAWGWPDFGGRYGPALQLDDEGNLWVAEYYMPGEDRNARSVFDPSGTWLGMLELPLNFSPLHIGSDFVLGIWRDKLDVEHVRLYALRKHGA